jgi:two-component system, sensor histidine kinase and response regulator
MKNILVIEDTPAILEEICDILRMEGFVVYEAENGKTGLELALKLKPSLIISDILMPEIDGFKLLTELKNNNATKLIPVILLTAKANKEAVKIGLEMGAGEYLIKPISADDLIRTVIIILKKQYQGKKQLNMPHHEKKEDFNH